MRKALEDDLLDHLLMLRRELRTRFLNRGPDSRVVREQYQSPLDRRLKARDVDSVVPTPLGDRRELSLRRGVNDDAKDLYLWA